MPICGSETIKIFVVDIVFNQLFLITINGTIFNRNVSSREFFDNGIIQITKLYNKTWISLFDE